MTFSRETGLASRSKAFPCRKPGCAGGSDKSAWGRQSHEDRAHPAEYLGPRTPNDNKWTGASVTTLIREDDAYPCRRCPQTFSTQGALLDHLRAGHVLQVSA